MRSLWAVTAADNVLDLGALTNGRPSAVVVFPVKVDAGACGRGWVPGPLPVVQPQNETAAQRGHVLPTKEEVRRTLVDEQQSDVLYGHRGLGRHHRIVDDDDVVAFEMLWQREPRSPGPGFGLMVAHVVPRDGASVDGLLTWHAQAVRRRGAGALAARLLQLAGPGLTAGSGRPRVLTFAVVPEARTDPGLRLTAAYAMVSGASADSWQAQADRAAGHELTLAKPDWSVLVLRDGAAYVSHDRDSEAYAETLRMLMHSVHLDALLLALVQRILIDQSGDRAVTIPLDQPDDLVQLESDHYEFRRTYWRTALTDKRTAPPDVVLHKFQDELLTTADVLDVEQRVSDGARLALSLHARQQQETQERLNRMVQNGSVIIGSFGLAFTAASVIADPGWPVFWQALAIGLAAMVVAFGILRLTGRRAGA